MAIRHMESSASMDLFFSVRSTKTDLLTILSFLIRTQWKYTQWIKLSVTFLAEDQTNIEANFFNVGNLNNNLDTSNLAGCSNSKEMRVLLPFKTQNFSPIKVLTFINGFELSTVNYLGSNTPY